MAWTGTHQAGVVSGGRKVSYYIKERLKAAGWTVYGSGDGAGNFSTTTDIITSANTGANGVDNTSSWFVMKKYCQLTEQWRHFSWQNSSTLGNIAVFDSHTAGFTGGSPSATRRMPATDERAVKGGGTDAAPSYTSAWLADMSPCTLHVIADSESASWYAFATRNDGTVVGHGGIGLDILVVGGDDPDPYVWFRSPNSGAYPDPIVERGTYIGWQGRGTARELWKQFGNTSGGYQGIGGDLRDNPFNSKWQLFPFAVADSVAMDTDSVFKGLSKVWRLCGHFATAGASDALKPTTLNVNSSCDWMTWRGRAFPWDGTRILPSTAEHGNFDAEDISYDVQEYTPAAATPTPPVQARVRAGLAAKAPVIKKVPRIVPGKDPALTVAIEPIRQAVNQIIDSPLTGARILTGITLDDAVETEVPHSLGRRPIAVIPCNIRGALSSESGGRVDYVPKANETRSVNLMAIGHGASITVDLLIL